MSGPVPGNGGPDPSTRRGRAVAGMFDAIAPTYDLLNHLLSFNVDRRWRRRAVRALAPSPGQRLLDLCAGTGDLALALLEAERSCRVVGADFSRPMLLRAPSKAQRSGVALPLVEADAMALPFRDAAFDGVTVAFGVRNFEDLDRGFQEMARVLRPGGRAVILEFSRPRGLFGWFYRVYFGQILPRVGRLISRDAHAYGYLPATVAGFPAAPELTTRLEAAGFSGVAHTPLTFGIATISAARRAP